MRVLILLLVIVTTNAYATKVLLIESYHSEYSWDSSYIRGLEAALLPEVKLDTFQMDTKRLPKREFENKANEAFALYQKQKPDIVILGDDNALSYMLPKLYDEEISIVFLGINANPRRLLSQYRGKAQVTGVLERPLFIKSLGELRSMFGGKAFKVRILFDSGVTSQIAKEFIENQYKLIRDNLGIEVDIQALTTKKQWRESVLTAKQEGFTTLIVGLYHTLVDHEGMSVPASEVIEWTSLHSELPLFAFWDFAVGENKAAGGMVLFGQSHGERAAKLVNQIIEQEQPLAIPIVTGNQGKAIYSQKEMERWNLMPPRHWQPID
jgi:hypothetical protein